jgi:Trm5-related predicted tRNA methylase
MLGWMSVAAYLRVVLLPALEGQLEVSRHEEEAAHLWGSIVAEDRERAAVAGIRQEAGVPLAAMQLRTRVNLRQVVPGFPKRVQPEEQAELIDDFVTAADAIVAVVDVEGIIRGND